MNLRNSTFTLLAALAVFSTNSLQAQFLGGMEPAAPTLKADVSAIQPGSSFQLAVHITIDDPWHIYWTNPGVSGLPTAVNLTLPGGLKAGSFRFSTPKQFTTAGQVGFGYEDEAWIITEVQVPEDLAIGSTANLIAQVSWLSCDDDSCLSPKNEAATLDLPVQETAAPSDSAAAINAAVAKLPTVSASAQFTAMIKDGNLVASIDQAALGSNAQDHVLWPARSGLVDHAKPQSVAVEGSTITFTQPAADGTDSLPPNFEALIKSGSGQAILVSTASSAKAKANPAPTTETMAETPVKPMESAEVAATPNNDFAAQQEAVQTMLGWGVVKANASSDAKAGPLPFPLLFLFAFVGGMILNLMPCVFPVLGIKIMGFVQQSGHDKAKVRKHGLVFGLGVLVSLWILAAVVIGIKLAGNQVLWGFQLQNPIFVVAMIVVIFVFGLNLAGVFEFGTSLTGAGQELQSKEGYAGSFFSGVLAVIIATPCTGPFMASALSYALNAPAIASFAIFTALGLGLAFPYVLLSYIPALIDKLPKPGAWMETFKQFMSFPMFATVVWLTSVYAKLAGRDALSYFLYGLVILSM
ncbi:MAG: cytochrome c biogenesis protein CcdA, partial [Verrucomicrobiota bacterium]